MAIIKDEFELEFERVRADQKAIRDQLKERREFLNDPNLQA